MARRVVANVAPSGTLVAYMLSLPPEDDRWLDFVAGHSVATPFHHPAWAKLLAETYGYSARLFAITDARAKPIAGFPALAIGGRLRRRRLVSLPFTDHCVPLVAAEGSTDLISDLLTNVRKTLEPASIIEIRAAIADTGVVHQPRGVLHLLRLDPDPDVVFAAFKRSQVQQPIAKAQREGVEVHRAESADELVSDFYRLHLATRRRLGVPVQPRRYFRLFWKRIVDERLGFVLLARLGKRPIAGGVFLSWNGTVVYKYGASDSEFLRLRPNNLLLWEAIRWSCVNGVRTFDFGRTDFDQTGLRAFKSGWGASEEPLIYSFVGHGSSAAERPTSRAGAGLLSPLIRKSPLWVCRAIGEVLYRYAA